METPAQKLRALAHRLREDAWVGKAGCAGPGLRSHAGLADYCLQNRSVFAGQHFGHFDIRQGFDIVIGGAEQQAAQAQKIAGDLKVDDLASAIG